MPFFIPSQPSSGERDSYNRNPTSSGPFFWTRPDFTWTWAFAVGYPAPPAGMRWPRMRLVGGDGMPLSDWIEPETNAYPFALNLPDGHYLARAEGAGAIVLAKPFVVNASGRPLPNQAPWTAAVRFELTNARYGYSEAQVLYPGTLPVPKMAPFKPRTVRPTRTLLTKTQMHARRVHTHSGPAMTARFVEIPTGDVMIERDQKYFYSDAITEGLTPPKTTMRDGERGVGTIGFAYKGIVRRGRRGIYFLETNGRLGVMSLPPDGGGDGGRVTTLVGWRTKPGVMKAHAGLVFRAAQYGAPPAHKRFYADRWEYVGDWWLVPGVKKLHEPWGFAIAERKPDGSLDPRDGHEFWLCDTLNHRVLWANHWTTHAPDHYEPAHFPPLGYASPPRPTGQTTLAPFAGVDGVPTDLCNEPFDCAVRVQDEKLYWTNFAGHSIARANLDGWAAEVFIQSAKRPTLAEMGIRRRMEQSLTDLEELRVKYLIDGPPGVAVLTAPQGIVTKSNGNLLWVERYTRAVREYDFATSTVNTLVRLPGRGTGFGRYDFSIAIDSEGMFGPVDDFFVMGWHNQDWRFAADGRPRYSKDGVTPGRAFSTSGADAVNGPLHRVRVPNYGWMCAIGDGAVYLQGSASAAMMLEITERLPGDLDLDVPRWRAGHYVYTHLTPLYLTHGPDGQGELGFPTIDELGAWTDDELKAYTRRYAPNLREDQLNAFVYWVRCVTADQHYARAASRAMSSATRKPGEQGNP